MDLKQITQADIYDQDRRLRGLVDMFGIDERSATEVEHKTLGQVGVLLLPGRPLEALKGKVKIGHLDRDYDRDLANPAKVHDWQMHQRVDVNDAEGYSATKSHVVVWHAKFRTMKAGGMDTELGEKAEIEYEVSIPALKISVLGDDTPIWELDVWNDVFEINGVPVWS